MTKKTKIHVRNITVALKTAKLCKCFILAVISFIRVLYSLCRKSTVSICPLFVIFNQAVFYCSFWMLEGDRQTGGATGRWHWLVGWTASFRFPYCAVSPQHLVSFFDRLSSHSFPFSFFRFRFGLWRCVERVRGRPLLWPKLWSVSSPGVGNWLDFSFLLLMVCKIGWRCSCSIPICFGYIRVFPPSGPDSKCPCSGATSYLYRCHQWTGGR